MVDTTALAGALRARGVRLFTGVPDSLLQSLSSCLMQSCAPGEHIIAANEGNAVALAMGHYLACATPAVVYMQNSGLGNAVNPLTSLADPEVYGIPMLLVIGWRGEPGHKDEPQHVKQGRISAGQLELLEIPHWVVGPDSDMDSVLEQAWRAMAERGGPAALQAPAAALPPLTREAAIGRILDLLAPDDIVLATTGKTGRELYELRAARGEAQRDFLTVGGMGHTASIALGIALGRPQRRVVCLDGDGSMLMHLGATAITGDLKPANLVHVLLNNEAHESVGGQPTVAGRMDFERIALGCGYRGYRAAATAAELDAGFAALAQGAGPQLLEIRLQPGARKDLGRPSSTPQQNKASFMAHLRGAASP
jgi:phosphonopyruvate decarboxylase